MRRLMEKTVFSGLSTAGRFAPWPTSRSPFLVSARTEGVTRVPSLFSRTVGSPPSMTATTELVVPRSMPITFAITYRFISHVRAALCAARSIYICSTSSSSSSNPFTGKRMLQSTLIHAPKILLRQLRVGTLLRLGNMLGKLIDLLTDLMHSTFQIGEGSRHNNRLVHTLTFFRIIPLYAPLPLLEGI